MTKVMADKSPSTIFFETPCTEILVVSKHVIKGISELISNLLDLELFPVDLILDVVNPLVKLGDVHLTVLEPALSHFVLTLDAQNFVLKFLLPFHSLLCGLLELLHVLSDHLELLLDSFQVLFSQLCSVNCPPELLLLDS